MCFLLGIEDKRSATIQPYSSAINEAVRGRWVMERMPVDMMWRKGRTKRKKSKPIEIESLERMDIGTQNCTMGPVTTTRRVHLRAVGNYRKDISFLSGRLWLYFGDRLTRSGLLACKVCERKMGVIRKGG